MGNMALRPSKSYSEVKEVASPAQPQSHSDMPSLSAEDTPPKYLHVMSLVDPRSPNVEISRTPIMCEDEEKVREKKRSIREWMEAEVMKTPVEVCRDADTDLLFDPRSPTQEIRRTPISSTDTNLNPNYGHPPVSLSESKVADARFDDSGEVLKAARKNFDYDMSGVAGGQMCRDLRKRLFISQKLNESETELLEELDTSRTEERDKEN